jgi:Asp-tRNA(Asn)/Glu-tRNA(Gln) amidotransferase A subunit family amidase
MRAVARVADYYQRVRAFLERYDCVLTPTAGITAFRIGRPLPT